MNAMQPSSVGLTMKKQMSVVLAISAAVVLMGMLVAPVSCNDAGTNFFLKASKSVPRIGRRSDNFFLKASKSVPRIGRRRTLAPLTDDHDGVAVSSWPWFRSTDSIPGPSRRAPELPDSNPSPLTHADEEQYEDNFPWDTIEKAMEENPELWAPYLSKLVNQQLEEDAEYQRHLQAAADHV